MTRNGAGNTFAAGSGVVAYVALGSNLGDRRAHLDAALEAMKALPGTALEAVSPCFDTEPVGPAPQGRYLNAAAALRTRLGPRALLDALLAIERQRGRVRTPGVRWGPRTLDLDLLLFGDAVIDEPGMTIPHPRLGERLFVLEPLASIAPDAVIPGLGMTVSALLTEARRRNG